MDEDTKKPDVLENLLKNQDMLRVILTKRNNKTYGCKERVLHTTKLLKSFRLQRGN